MSSSKGRRITVGIGWGVMVAIILTVVPLILVDYINDLMGSTIYTLPSIIPLLGIVIGALSGSSKAASGSFFQGPLAMASGAATIGYIYSASQGGMLSFSFTQQGSQLTLGADISNLMLLFLLVPVIGIVKAGVQTVGYKRLQTPSKKKESPKEEVPERAEEVSAVEENPKPADN
ncbi:MAG: hypothetical protein ACE5KG_05200 [Nitrososphaerales archaeon]